MYEGLSAGIFDERSAGETSADDEERMSISVARSMDWEVTQSEPGFQ